MMGLSLDVKPNSLLGLVCSSDHMYLHVGCCYSTYVSRSQLSPGEDDTLDVRTVHIGHSSHLFSMVKKDDTQRNVTSGVNFPWQYLNSRINRHCIQHSRFTKQDGWQLWDLSLSLCGNIAVTGYNENTKRTSIDVYSSVKNSDSRDKPKIFYSKEFEKYEDKGTTSWGRYVSFVSDEILVSCLGNKLEVFQVSKDEVLRSRKVNGLANCLSVREREIFIGFKKSNKITVYDVTDLNEIKSIILQGIQDGDFPYDMTVIADRILVCVGHASEESNDRSLIFDEKSGKMLSELTKPTDTRWYTYSVTVCVQLGVVAVVWFDSWYKRDDVRYQIVFYSLFSANNSSFLIVEIESVVSRIRISDRGDRMVTMNKWTGEMKVYDMAEIYTFHHLKENLTSEIQKDECVRLTNYFAVPKDQSDVILKSEAPTENLLLALEERGVIHPSNVDRLMEAFHELKISSFCSQLVEIYKNTRMQATSYDRFLATLSAHLTASLPGDLCDYFNIDDETKSSVTSSQSPGLSLLLALDESEVIKPSDVRALEKPFTEMQLVQAVAKIQEYESEVEEEKSQSLFEGDGKRERFIRYLQKKIKSWYETMTPVPWKKSCRWKSSDLFVGSGLILTDSKTKKSMIDIDEQCKLEYAEIFTHERLKSEIRVILEGDPGSGKTMLASQLAYDWSAGKIRDVDMIIFLPLKVVGSKTLVESIQEFYVPESKDLSVADIEEVVRDEGNKCCFILDGLEEYSGGGDTSEVSKVMAKEKYPSCKVILTSRSDFTHDLPSYPMLKLGRFGETERNAYIAKVFSDDSQKQLEVKAIIEDNPFILDMCSSPLLFVLAVHNIDSMGQIQKEHLNRVTPFMKNMVETLCPTVVSDTGKDVLDLDNEEQRKTSLGEIAFNGLCRGLQQLSWEKGFIEMNAANSKEWLDSGILVVEDSSATFLDKRGQVETLPLGTQSQTDPLDSGAETTLAENLPSTSKMAQSPQKTFQDTREWSESAKPTSETDMEATSETDIQTTSSQSETLQEESDEVSDEMSALQIESEEQVSETGSIAKHVPLQVKFLHKIIQEWFAARHFSLTIPKFESLADQQRYLSESLSLINPADLHYVLRFSCALHPPCTHFIVKHLLTKNRLEGGCLPEYILNCAFLCFAEYDGDAVPGILEAVMMVCKENITIHSEDSRLLQQAKVSTMKLASDCGIFIKKILIDGLVISATKDALTFNSGVTLEVIETLHSLEISRWDQQLKEQVYPDIVKFVGNCSLLEEARLYFPVQPPELDKGTLVDLLTDSKIVTWIIGSRVRQTLDSTTGEWRLDSGEHHSASLLDNDENRTLNQQTSLLEAEATISNEGGTIEIPNTGVKLEIPPDAFYDGVEQCLIQLRIILPGTMEEPSSSFTSNTSTVVELLPNNLRLKRTAQLTLPHCLELEEGFQDQNDNARIFVSHHESGDYPMWEETDLQYSLDNNKCTISLWSFCWVKYQVNGVRVKGKRIQVYTAGRELVLGDYILETEVGYYPDLPGGGEILRNNEYLIVSQQKSFIFVKKGKMPLSFTMKKVVPSSWIPLDTYQEVPFRSIADSEEYSCPFAFEHETRGPSIPFVLYRISQGDRGFRLTIRPQVKGANI